MEDLRIIDVTAENAEKEGLFCMKNPSNPGFRAKLGWLGQRIEEGLRLKVLKDGEERAGFIEYLPAEKAWRPVHAPGYMFIHCLWVYPKKFHGRGYAARLVRECIEDARASGMEGVAVTVSEGSWMAGPSVFEKNGFLVTEEKDRFQLMANRFGESELPAFREWEKEAEKYPGLHLVLAHQCPLFLRSVEEMIKTAEMFGRKLEINVLETAAEAQRAPSGYGTYTLIYKGRVLADHYVSHTHFRNILTRELQE